MEAVEAWSSSRGSGSGWWRSRAAGLQLPPPDFRSRRPPPLFPPLLSSLLSQLARQGPAACPRGLYPRDFPRARLALPFPCARLAPAPSHASFPAVFLASARLPARRGVRRTPWRRLSSRGDAIRQKVMAGWTLRFRNRPDDKAMPRRRHKNHVNHKAKAKPLAITVILPQNCFYCAISPIYY